MPDKKLTPEELLSQPIDVEALLNHEFEYYIWFRGHSHRLEYQRHENIDAAKARGGRLHHRFDLGWFGHVSAAVIGVHAIVAGGLCLQLGNQGSITKAIE